MVDDSDVDDLLDRLDRARSRVRTLRGDLGMDPSDARSLREPLRTAEGLLDGYEDRATGTGDFAGYLEFRQAFDDLVEGLDTDLPHRSAFEGAQTALDHRRLAEHHFEEARSALAPVREAVEALDALEAAEDEVGRFRRSLQDRLADLEARRDQLDDLSRLDPSTLETSVATLRDPVERYNEAVAADFERYLADTPSRAVMTTYDRLAHFALLEVEGPPPSLRGFLEDHPVGDEPVPRLLEYLEYSRSKLGHYVAEPGHVLGELRPHAPYLEGLSAAPFRIDWPPPEADTMRWTARELHQAANRFAAEGTMATLREVEALVRDDDRYETLRTAARARHDLDDAERDLVTSGRVEEELSRVDERIDRIATAIEG